MLRISISIAAGHGPFQEALHLWQRQHHRLAASIAPVRQNHSIVNFYLTCCWVWAVQEVPRLRQRQHHRLAASIATVSQNHNIVNFDLNCCWVWAVQEVPRLWQRMHHRLAASRTFVRRNHSTTLVLSVLCVPTRPHALRCRVGTWRRVINTHTHTHTHTHTLQGSSG